MKDFNFWRAFYTTVFAAMAVVGSTAALHVRIDPSVSADPMLGFATGVVIAIGSGVGLFVAAGSDICNSEEDDGRSED